MHTKQVTSNIFYRNKRLHSFDRWKNFFVQSVKANLIAYQSIGNIVTGQGDDYTTDWLLDYNYCKNYYKMIAIDLNKQQALDADPKAIQQISLTNNLAQDSKSGIKNSNYEINVTCKFLLTNRQVLRLRKAFANS